jgi:pyruvate kinase
MVCKKTKIVSTVGPSLDKPEILKGLVEAGVNVFRFNFSHGTHETHGKIMDSIRKLKLNVAIMLDTKGPEIRTGEVRGKLSVKVGDKFTITTVTGVYEDTGKVSVNYKGFINDVDVGNAVVFDGGVMTAKAVKKTKTDIVFEVIEGGTDIVTKRHINLLGKPVNLPTITEQDWKDIDFGIEKKVDFIAMSFVRSAENVVELRKYCESKGANIKIISKIENFEATQNLEEIVIESDGIMIARGDLACEIPLEKVPAIQKKLISLCSEYNKPVIVATQMLLSMIDNIRPTRAEVSDVANAVYDGADAVMTSEETTKSTDPINVVRTMSRIVQATEKDVYGRDCDCGLGDDSSCGCGEGKECVCEDYECNYRDSFNITETHGIVGILPDLTEGAEAIVVLSNDEFYANTVSAQRLSLPIFAFTNNEKIATQLHLVWNVNPVFEKKISGDNVKDLSLIDKFMGKLGFESYLAVFDITDGKKVFPTVQLRDL